MIGQSTSVLGEGGLLVDFPRLWMNDQAGQCFLSPAAGSSQGRWGLTPPLETNYLSKHK